MTIKLVKRPPNGAELLLEGKLEMTNAASVQDAILKMVPEYRELELNFANLLFVSSAGLRALMTIQKQVNRSGGTLTISHVSKPVMEVLEMTGFNSFLNIV